jgi:diketogulonate reductase-like aldo/keto reductase
MSNNQLVLGDSIPAVGFGTWQLSPQEAYDSVKSAIDAGYRLIDTAKIYRNEEAVGKAISDSGLPREDLFVTTKLWNSDQGYQSALDACRQSLEKLGLDYLDLYLIHWPGHGPDARHESWRAFTKLKEQGLVKHIGVSNFTVRHLQQLMQSSDVLPEVNQCELHPFIYDQQKDIVDFCHQHKIIFEAYSPLAQGHLTDDILTLIGKKHGKSASQVMLRWAIQKDTLPLPRSRSAAHIKENLEIFDFELSTEEMRHIDELSRDDRQSWDPTDLP